MPRLLQSMQAKVIAIFLALTAVSLGGLSVLSYVGSSSIFMRQTSASMQSILEFRAANLRNELVQVRDQAASLAKIEAIQQSMVNLKGGWKSLDKNPGDARKELQKYFVASNPNPPEARSLLIKPEGPSGYYYSAHAELQPVVAKLLAGSPFSDLLMADAKGNIFFSYAKGETFAENATEPQLAGTGLGKVFKAAADSVAKAESDEIPASFSGLAMNRKSATSDVYVAVPIANLGVLRGIMMFKLRDAVLVQAMTMAIPDGSSEKTNIVTSDGTVIGATADGKLTLPDATAYHFKDTGFASTAMTSAGFDRADGPATSFSIPVHDAGQTYLIVESILDSNLHAGAMQIAGLLMVFGVVVLGATSLIAWFILRRMFAPLAKLASATETVANGDLGTVITGAGRNDEMGTMSRALIRFRDSLIAQREMEAQAKSSTEANEAARLQRLQQDRAQAESRERVVTALGRGLNQLAEGDLTAEIVEPFPPELESLRQDFNSSAAKLAEAMTAIGANATAISTGSEEMRASADQLATRTERQTASISEAAAAIDAIAGTVKAQMERAEQATRMARDATDGSEASALIMEQTIQAMQAIQGSSQQINMIINVIDDIAFQTNLLALNAGVEAARAGESGKGFAVVAQEVRELAQRSAKAAREISDLLGKSTGEVATGVALVEKAGASLKAIGADVRAIGGAIEAMMLSTREEAQSLGDINASIGQIETMTQQNAVMVEETTAAIHRLAQEAVEMDQRLGQFQLAAPAAHEWRRAG